MHLPFAMYMYLVYITFQTKTPNPELCVQHEQIKIININKETFLTVIVNMIMLVWRDFLTLIICSSMLNSLSDKHCSSFGMLCLYSLLLNRIITCWVQPFMMWFISVHLVMGKFECKDGLWKYCSVYFKESEWDKIA